MKTILKEAGCVNLLARVIRSSWAEPAEKAHRSPAQQRVLILDRFLGLLVENKTIAPEAAGAARSVLKDLSSVSLGLPAEASDGERLGVAPLFEAAATGEAQPERHGEELSAFLDAAATRKRAQREKNVANDYDEADDGRKEKRQKLFLNCADLISHIQEVDASISDKDVHSAELEPTRKRFDEARLSLDAERCSGDLRNLRKVEVELASIWRVLLEIDELCK